MAEVPSIRNDFYIGGMSTMEQNLPRPDANNYVEQLKPVNGTTQKTPIVTIHGQAQTGTVEYVQPLFFFCSTASQIQWQCTPHKKRGLSHHDGLRA